MKNKIVKGILIGLLALLILVFVEAKTRRVSSEMGLTGSSKMAVTQNQETCTCNETLEKVVKKVEANYVGYALTKKEIETEYVNHLNSHREIAKSTSEENCMQMLQGFLRFFKDEHLFVSEIPSYAEDQLVGFKTTLKEKLFDVDEVYNYLNKNKSQLTPIEGIWTDGSARLAVIKNPEIQWQYQYVGVILSHTQQEKVGELKFGLNNANNLIEGTYYNGKYAPRYVSAETVKDNSLLSLSGGIVLGRVNVDSRTVTENSTLANPLKPTLKQLNQEVLLFTIPSFLIEKKLMDEVLNDGRDLLRNAKYLIIDIRGNGGGNGIYFDLLQWYADKKGESESGLALSSADNIAYFEKFSGGKKNNLHGVVVSEMQSSPRNLVSGPKYQALSVNSEKTKIEKVIILTDQSNASAAEQFILHSKQTSGKVTTIGQNTKGVIDYQSVNMVDLNCGERGIYFGYPTSTRHAKIPLDGYNATGIKPDVSTVKTGDELLAFALEQLQR